MPEGLGAAVVDRKRQLSAERPAPATRKASQMALELLTEMVPSWSAARPISPTPT